jgi:hypothetical protein
MGTMGFGVMDSMAFSRSSKSNSKIDGNRITFCTIDFQPHPPTLSPIFASLDQEMDLMMGSFNFHVGSLGSLCLSDLIPLGSSAGKTAATATSETSVSSPNEVNLPASIKPMEGKRNIIDELDEIMENLDLKEPLDYSYMGSEGNFDSISNYSKEDFTARYGNVSYISEDEWMSGLELYDNEQTIFSSDANHCISNQHQVYVVIDKTSKEFDDNNNPVINLQNLGRCAKYRAKGYIDETIPTRVTVRLSAAEWETIKQAVNHGGVLPQDASRNILMGYRYALRQQGKCLQQEKSEIQKRRESVSATSKILREERSNVSYTNNGRHHRHCSRVDNLEHGNRRNLARNLESSLLSVDEWGNIVQKTLEAALIAAQSYLLNTHPTPSDLHEGMHRPALQGLGMVGNRLQRR